jgi:phage terminase large subunit-like protein
MHVPGPENYAAEGYYQHNTGKTKAGSNWTLEMALSRPDIHVGVCGPTYDDVRAVCLEGESGLIAEAKKNGIEIVDYNKNRQEVLLANGSKIRGFSAEKPDSIRGQNLSYVWFDELASIRYFGFFHEGLMPALRKGERPRLLITTTPKRIRLIRKLIEDSGYELTGKDGGPGTGVHLTQAISAENIHFSRIARERLEREYAGNPVMLQQELQGLLLADAAGSLFPIEQFNETRVYPAKDTLPQWRRVVIAVDPATTNKDTSDETGIVAGAEGDDGDFYILEDCSGRFSPDQQMRVVAEAYYRNNADCVVGEVNMTGDYMRALLSTVDPNIPLRTVHGMKGKVSRAQGPSSLFAQGRVHMVGDNFRLLEDQLSAMAEGDDRNRMKDDRADACLAEGTLVLTSRGEVPIEQVVPGDLAWTRAGWKPVTATRCTQQNAEVITVFLSNGRELTGTRDHRIWTENDGWKRLNALVWGDILSGWNHLRISSSRGTPTIAIRTARAGAIASITSTTQPEESDTCIATYGSPRIRVRKSRKAGTSITRTRIRSTTPRPTLSFSRQPSTMPSTLATSPGRKKTSSSILTGSGRWLLSGTGPRRVRRGTPNMARNPGRTGSNWPPVPARVAVPRSSRGWPTQGTARAAASTGPLSSGCGRLPSALSAKVSTRRAARVSARPAPASVLGSYVNCERRDVYDLTVADVHEFTASGVIVHNCVWLLLHLSGTGQGNWAQVYGFRDCVKCGSRVNEDKDTRCSNCGAEVTKQAPKHAGGRPAQIPWSEAYLKTCPNGHKYTPRERSCPNCAPSPETYLQRALAASQPGGKLGYMGKDWLAGRRL